MPSIRLHIILSFFLLIISNQTTLIAQDYDYIQYTTDDGLPTNYVYGVVEDDDGYIWAYTENGIAKFDGYTFKNFSVKDGLPTNDIVYAGKGGDGKLWLHPYKGKPTFIENDSVVVFSDRLLSGFRWFFGKAHYLISSDDGLRQRVIRYSDKNNKCVSVPNIIDSSYIFSGVHNMRIDSITPIPYDFDINQKYDGYTFMRLGTDSIFYHSKANSQSGINVLKIDQYITYNFANNRCAWKLGDKQGVFSTQKTPNFKDEKTKSVNQLGVLNKYLIDISPEGYFYILDIDNESLITLDFPKNLNEPKKYHSVSFQDSSFIINSNRGFIEYDFDGEIIDHAILGDLGSYYTLNTFYKDSKKNIWIGSREAGLFLIPSKSRKTVNISSRYSRDKTFEWLIETENRQLLGITESFGIYNIEENKLLNIIEGQKKFRFRSAVKIPEGIIASSSGKALLIKADKKNFHTTPILVTAANDCKNTALVKCCSGHQNNYKGFKDKPSLSYDSYNKQIYHADYSNRIIRQDLRNAVPSTCIYFASDIKAHIVYSSPFEEKIIVSNKEGIYQLKDNQILPVNKKLLSLKNVSTLYATKGKLWIGTESNGLFSYNFSSEELIQVSKASNIRQIRPYTDSTLLIASNEGVIVIPKEGISQKHISYTSLDGLFTNETQDVYYDGKQYIYVANTEGIQRIDRQGDFSTHLEKSDLTITQITANDNIHTIDSSLSFLHNESNLNFQYHLNAFASNGNIEYATKLEPLETEWQTSKARNINYLSLPSRKYTFFLKAKDVYGNVVEHDPVHFEILPAFWQTSWFKVLMAIIFVALILLGISLRDRIYRTRLQKEKSVSRKMAELELSALRAQMNPHFVFNALGAIQYHIQTNEVEAADNYLTRFAMLMRKYLDSSKEKMISLKHEIELLTIYTELEQLRFEGKFEVHINTSSDLLIEDVELPSMMIQPFIENAINHGLNERKLAGGLLEINFSGDEQTLKCEIRDNGIGRENAKKYRRTGHKSRGMQIIKEKMETLRLSGIADIKFSIEDLYSENQEYPGTYVQLLIKNIDYDEL